MVLNTGQNDNYKIRAAIEIFKLQYVFFIIILVDDWWKTREWEMDLNWAYGLPRMNVFIPTKHSLAHTGPSYSNNPPVISRPCVCNVAFKSYSVIVLITLMLMLAKW